MNLPQTHDPQAAAQAALQRYYRLQARLYDLTRWTFLRGRKTLMTSLAPVLHPRRIVEVGCGTGTNLLILARLFPSARLWGVDLSGDMLAVARRKLRPVASRVTLVQAAYDRPLAAGPGFDLMVFSYALSMFNPGWQEAVAAAITDLAPDGTLAVVDFHDSTSPLFRKWMGLNHVRLEGHLLPHLRSRFRSCRSRIRPVYGGLWSYFSFHGQNPR